MNAESQLGVNGIAYTVVFAKDYQGMKSFYEKVFGQKAEEAHPPEEWATWNFSAEGSTSRGAGFAIHGGAAVTYAEITKSLEAQHGPQAIQRPQVLPVLTVENLSQTVEEMKSNGVEVTRDVYEEQPSLWAADIKDPEGNPINLVEVRR